MSRTYTQNPHKLKDFVKIQPWIKSEDIDRRREFTRLKFLSFDMRCVRNIAAAMDLKNYMTKEEWWTNIGYLFKDKAPRQYQYGCPCGDYRNLFTKRERFRTKRALKNNAHNNFEDYFEGDCVNEHRITRYFS